MLGLDTNTAVKMLNLGKIDPATMLGLDTNIAVEMLNLGKISSDLIASRTAVTQSMAVRDAIATATSPAVENAQQWLRSDAGRRTTQAAASANETEEPDDEH